MTIQPKPHDLIAEQAPALERAELLAFAMQANDPAWRATPADPREGAPCRWVHLTNGVLTIDVFREVRSDVLEFRPCFGTKLNGLAVFATWPYVDRSVQFHCQRDEDVITMLTGVIMTVVPQCRSGLGTFAKYGLTTP